MKILIAYGTRHGTTEACARKLEQLIEADIDLLRLEKGTVCDLSPYDMVIIGSPVYTGRFPRQVNAFMKTRAGQLAEKRIGLYICCITPLREAEKYLKGLFPDNLVSKACAIGVFGGVFDFRKMSFLERLLIRRVKKVPGDMSTLSDELIGLFAKAVQEVCLKQ